MDSIQNNQPVQNSSTPSRADIDTEKEEVNIYPAIRHLFLIICILLAIAIILFLFYQNGKSIYDNGI